MQSGNIDSILISVIISGLYRKIENVSILAIGPSNLQGDGFLDTFVITKCTEYTSLFAQ